MGLASELRTIVVCGLSASGMGSAILSGIVRFAERRGGWRLNVTLDANLDRRQCDAVIGALHSSELVDQVVASGRPAVNVSDRLDDRRVAKVCCDERAVGQMAAEHLLDLGYRRLVYVGVPQAHFSVLRYAGFTEALRGAQLECEVFRPEDEEQLDWEGRLAALPGWLGGLKKPVGVFCGNDAAAGSVWGACVRAGVACPEEVAIVGVDNEAAACLTTTPALTSIALPFERMGHEAARLIATWLEGHAPSLPAPLPPVGLIARGSTRAGGSDDPVVRAALSYIAANIGEAIDVESVLDELGVSRRLLETRFRASLGKSPAQAIRAARLQQARQLLVSTDLPVTEVAERCGCANLARLAELFRREIGRTPSAVRAEARIAQ